MKYDAIIVGAGISGLHLLHRLREAGLSVLVVDQATGVGGTWFWNRYPGARCDIESMTYSYSWSHELEQEWTWTERYAGQAEILAYLEHVADRFDLRRDLRLGTRVAEAHFDEPAEQWSIATDDGERLSATFLIMATGCLSLPRIPGIPGLERFAGEMHHTGLWPHHGVDVAGKRVGVIGTGSSAVQAIPVIAAEARQLTVFQRTANFSVPAWNGPLDAEAVCDRKARYELFRRAARTTTAGNPWNARAQSVWDATPEEREREFEERYAVGGFCLHAAYSDLFSDPDANELVCEFIRRKIRERVHDPEVAELLCPYDHPLGTKRMCVDTDYFETYNRASVRLVSIREHPIDEITETGLRVGDEEFTFDTIVLGTGFDALTGALLAIDLHGRDGVSLREKWAEGPRSALGLMIAGFPNLFTVTGPSSPSVLSNMMVSIEQHVDWIARCIEYLREHGISTIEPTPAEEDAWMEHHRAVGDASLYPRAKSWYMGANIPGKPRVLLPYVGGVGSYRELCEAAAEGGYPGFALGHAP
ncbi:MAG TPA: NAD(P)/FAD-dependent oxidoreductase [Gaiellales bacterium]|nr:NAD(P)/FAD-dependent oxidoreductase [Gaiellales bacterium]